jgi:hypothetical protein
MQYRKGYPVEYLLDFLDPTFPDRVRWDHGFGQSVLFQSGRADVRAVQREICSYLEEWIDSGVQTDGSERPYERNFAPKSCRKAWSFEDGKPNLFPPSRAVKAMAKFCNGSLMVRENSYLIVGHEEANTSGSVSVSIGSRGGIEYEPTFGSVSDDPEVAAAGMFLEFYRSEWLFRLMQCRHCRKFAVPNRKPRNSYVRGWLCSKCSKTVPAAAATENSRRCRHKQWFDLAVDACIELNVLSLERRGIDRVAQITEKVNAGLPLMDRIKRNTITRNLAEIDRIAAKKGGKPPGICSGIQAASGNTIHARR